MWGSAAAVNVRRQDDGPARGQASLGPRIARTVLACALVAGGDAFWLIDHDFRVVKVKLIEAYH